MSKDRQFPRPFHWYVQNDHTHLKYQVTFPNSNPNHKHFTGTNWVCRAQLHLLIWLCLQPQSCRQCRRNSHI